MAGLDTVHPTREHPLDVVLREPSEHLVHGVVVAHLRLRMIRMIIVLAVGHTGSGVVGALPLEMTGAHNSTQSGDAKIDGTAPKKEQQEIVGRMVRTEARNSTFNKI